MPLLSWFLRNWADTDEGGDADLAPVELNVSSQEALERVATLIRQLPLWQLQATDPATGTVTATRRTRLFRFVDDITIRLEATPSGTRVHARSQSRVGVGDLGQNRRNLLELLGPLRTGG
ncbi:MAG: DUF1499 domain-containing protein [Gemmataceae bacterium]